MTTSIKSLLDGCRKCFGPAPRRFGRADARYLQPAPPAHVQRDPLRVVYRERALLLERGEVVWARLVQANDKLFAPGQEDLPAVAVFSPDPFFDERPEVLGQIARGLFELKGRDREAAEGPLADFARAITNERERLLNRELPPELSGERLVFYTTIMVLRSHLPHGLLASGLFPLLALPSSTKATYILPSRFWAPPLLYAWQTMLDDS